MEPDNTRWTTLASPEAERSSFRGAGRRAGRTRPEPAGWCLRPGAAPAAEEDLELEALAGRASESPAVCFCSLCSEAYKTFARRLHAGDPIRQRRLERLVHGVREVARARAAQPLVMGRVKSCYSIWRKLRTTGRPFDEIFDHLGVRVIVDREAECHAVLRGLVAIYRPLEGRLRNYIDHPKSNGYQSLHHVLLDAQQLPFEVQIRTWDMHEQCEHGTAAHWRYKRKEVEIPGGV
jgi:(p)ppGpp synthase/HD superfamily hydrolase